MAGQQRKDLELVFSLQSHYKHFFKNYGDIVGVYDIPSITMQWESFKSYLLKNSGILFDNCQSYATALPSTSPSQSVTSSCSANSSNSLQLLSNDIHIRYINTSGIELPINTQEDFQYALYTFRERARAGEINHLKLTRGKVEVAKPPKVTATTTSGGISQMSIELNRENLVHQVGVEVQLHDNVDDMFEVDTTTDDVDEGIGGHGLGRRRIVVESDEKTPDWFTKYMKKFKQEIIQEITKVNTTQMSSNLKKMQAANHVACPKRRQNKSEHYKRRPKMSYSNNMAALENTSCDNTDINTIATTPNPPPKLPENPKSDNKPTKLKAKLLANMRGSSDSDTFTVNPHNFSLPQTKPENPKRFTLPEQQTLRKEDFKNMTESELNDYLVDEIVASARFVDVLPEGIAMNFNVIIDDPPTKERNTQTSQVKNNQDCDDIKLMEAKVLREERNVCLGQVEGFEGPVYLQQWNLKNTGSKNWDDETEVCFAWGSIVPFKGKIPCPLLKPGESGTVSLFYRIPDRAGMYECYCHLVHRGRRFGPWLGFKVNLNTTPLPYAQPRAFIIPITPPPLKPQTHKQYPYEQTQGRELYSSLLTLTRTYKNNNRGCELTRLELGQNDTTTGTTLQVSTYTVQDNDCPNHHHHHQQQQINDEAPRVQINDVQGDDVVAVIQGVVVRVDGLVGDVDIEVKKKNGELDGGSPVVMPQHSSFKRFKGNEQPPVIDEPELYIMELTDKHIRCANELHKKQLASNQLQLHTDSEDDEDSDDDYDNDDYDGDINVGKDLVMVDKHHLQQDNNSDSDNASIVSIPESIQSNHSAVPRAQDSAVASSSLSSGHGSEASEEFVVIPMPKRVVCSLSDCEDDDDDDSCPEMNPTLASIYEPATPGKGKREEKKAGNVGEKRGESVEKGESKRIHTESIPTANAPTFQNNPQENQVQPLQPNFDTTSFPLSQQHQYLINQQQIDLSQSHYRTAIPLAQNFDCFRNEHVSQESAGFIDQFKPANRVNTEINNDSVEKQEVPEKLKALVIIKDPGFDRSLGEQQTCPVDLSTNSSKAESVSDNTSEFGPKKPQKSEQHCAATLCDLCTNIIMKNKVENNKNRLFVFPKDSPGFEVFAPVNKNAIPMENQIESATMSPQISKKTDVIMQKQSNIDLPIGGLWAVQQPSNSPQTFKFAQNNLTFDSPNLHSTPNNQKNSTCTFKSSLNLKKRGKDTFYDSGSSNDSSSFTCPSCQCDGLCWRYQGKTELDYRNHLAAQAQKFDVSAQALKHDVSTAHAQKALSAGEIRLQMRNLFVQLAELEPQKDPYLKTDDKTSKRTQMKLDAKAVSHEEETEIKSERAKIPLFMQRHLKDRKQASKKLRFVRSCSSSSVIGKDKIKTEVDGKEDAVETLADQFQTNFRLTDFDEPMPDITNIAQPAVRDVCSKGLPHAGCPYRTHLFLDHKETEHPKNTHAEQPVVIGKLIDVSSPEDAFIEGASAPVENDNQTEVAGADADIIEDESISHAVEQQRLIQLHCNDDADLGDNMRALIDMGFPNFYFNLQLLKSNENNIILALEKLLPNF